MSTDMGPSYVDRPNIELALPVTLNLGQCGIHTSRTDVRSDRAVCTPYGDASQYIWGPRTFWGREEPYCSSPNHGSWTL